MKRLLIRNGHLIEPAIGDNSDAGISSDVADSSCSLILDQVKYGVAVLMAVLYLATGGSV